MPEGTRYPPKVATRAAIRMLQRSCQRSSIPHRPRRAFQDRAARLSPLPRGTAILPQPLSGVPSVRFELGPADPDRAVLYLHGGSFCAGSPVTHRALASRLAGEARMPVHALDYRLAPEHPYPAALEDAEAAYLALLDSGSEPGGPGLDPGRVVIAGDSAGGWLALALAVRLRDRGGPLPAGLALVCPFLDMTLSGETLETNRERDVGLRPDWVRETRPLFFAGPGLVAEELSAVRGDLTGLPPIHLQAASDDILLSDAELLRDRAREQGAELDFRRWEDVWHDFQLTAGSLREADEAVEALGGFARKVTGARDPGDVAGRGSNGRRATPRIAIVGAGFGGIGLGIALKRAGIDSFTILDRGDRVGGVWRDNTYPGLACDVPSRLYEYAFEPNPDWSRVYSPQSEILAYLERCAEKNGIGPHLRLGTEVVRADYTLPGAGNAQEGAGDGGARVWQIQTGDGATIEADVLVSACGQLSRPWVPDLPGMDHFHGRAFHSSRWDHDAELSGKRVAVIGTGASTVQIVPSIAPNVAQLDLYQRSAPYVVPKKDRPYRWWERRLVRFGPIRRLARFRYWLLYELLQTAFGKRTWIQRLGARFFRREFENQVPEGPLREAAAPRDELGCKRVLVSSDYYPALQRPNVELIPHGVRELTATGVVADDGIEREADVIVFSTGFATTEFLAPMEVRGEGGAELNQAWREGAEAYLGMTVTGFPNLFVMYGPNTNLGAGSIIYQLESQMNYILDAVRAMPRHGTAISLRPEVQREFAREMSERLGTSVWNTGCSSWYVDANGRNTNNWPGRAIEYRRRTRRLDLDDYVVSA